MTTKTQKKLPYWPVKLLAEGKVHGGKSYLARRIFKAAPREYTCFLDSYGGMGSMTYNAPAGLKHQVFVEKDWHRYVLKDQIKTNHEALLKRLRSVRYDEKTFEWACGVYNAEKGTEETHCRLESAFVYLCVSRMSRGGLPDTGFSWTPETTRLRGGQQAETNAWEKMLTRVPVLHERLQPVKLYYGMAAQYIAGTRYATGNPADWFIYLDPTYLPAVRSTDATEYGDDEMTPDDHEALVDSVRDHPSKIAISHYPHPLYDGLGWRTLDFDMPNHAGQTKTKQRRTERLYMNY